MRRLPGIRVLVGLIVAHYLRQTGASQRTIEIVVAYGAGGSTDLVGALAENSGAARQSVVVLNKPGGRHHRCDVGYSRNRQYTLYVERQALIFAALRSIKYSIGDFEPIAVTRLVPLVLIASKNIRATNLQG